MSEKTLAIGFSNMDEFLSLVNRAKIDADILQNDIDEINSFKVKVEIKNIKETKHCVCQKCGKQWHLPRAKYCGMCGTKLKEASVKDSL